MKAEAERQQRLLQALWSREDHGLAPAGLQAYRANAGAAAERALAAACPTVQQLLGDEAFAALARALWQRCPPQRGDLALWGGELPALLAEAEALRDEAYLADVARLDLAAHRAETAPDADLDPASLARLADGDPERLRLRLASGAVLIVSPHPVATIWLAHRSTGADRFAPVRAAFDAGRGEIAFVWRRGWRGDVAVLDAAEAAFMQALLDGADLGTALDAAPGLDFEAWLARALRAQWLADVMHTTEQTP
jgi:hypothetical protein